MASRLGLGSWAERLGERKRRRATGSQKGFVRQIERFRDVKMADKVILGVLAWF